MPAQISHIIKTLRGLAQPSPSRQDFSVLAAAAKADWLRAQAMYREAVEPELVDYHSYLIKAYEAYYAYLLRRIREETLGGTPFL